MNSRERVLTALAHRAPDAIPRFYRDVPEVRDRLKKDLGFDSDDDLLEALGIDFRWLKPEYTGPILEDPDTGHRRDIWGVEYRYVLFNDTEGYWEPVMNPMKDWVDPVRLDSWTWPDLAHFDLSRLSRQAEAYADYALMTAPGFASPGLFQCPIQVLVGEEQSFLLPLTDPDFFRALAERATAFNTALTDAMCAACRRPDGSGFDFFRIGDDFGTQQSLVMSPTMWRDFIGPGLKSMADAAKIHGAHYYHHSCGAVRALIPDLLELGVEVLDPVQVTATGMVPAELKAAYGDRLCFSGGVDEMHLLRSGSPGDVREAVFRLCDDMQAGDGGFFIGPTHNFQADVSTDNVVALYEAAGAYL